MPLKRITIFVDDSGPTSSDDYLWVEEWLSRWWSQVRIARYSTGGYEHLWDVEASDEAISEVPEHMHCTSDWSHPNLSGT
jgi:hypothetical protein